MSIPGSIRLMKDISAFGFKYLQDSHFKRGQMTDKQVLVMAYFTHAQAHYDGVLALVCKPKSQPSTAHLQMRALQETWINVSLMTCVEEDTWSNYLYMLSEYDRMKIAEWLLKNGQINQAKADKISNEASQLISNLKGKTNLPDIIDVMYPSKLKRDFFGKQPLNLREKCLVIDHYKGSTSNNSMAHNYDVVYRFLSKYMHQDARTVLSAVKEGVKGEYQWNVGGDSDDITKVMGVAYSYYNGCLRTLTDLMGNTNIRRFDLFDKRFHKYLR